MAAHTFFKVCRIFLNITASDVIYTTFEFVIAISMRHSGQQQNHTSSKRLLYRVIVHRRQVQ